uniref:Smoothelin a n=1 Tax=Electrophorus electricus TaxID=8005 RepID=A0A4W4HRY2_ELEEL
FFLLFSQQSQIEGRVKKETMDAASPKTEAPPAGPLTQAQLDAIQDEQVLNDMLDKAVDFEERRRIRAAMRDLLRKKRGETQVEKSAIGLTATVTGLLQPRSQSIGPSVTQTVWYSVSQISVHSLFCGVDLIPPVFLAVTKQPRRNLYAHHQQVLRYTLLFLTLSPAHPPPSGVKVHRGSALGGPNTKDVKQMLLDWCRAKTEPYEGVNIQNFSSSWADGLAFCALVHRFFPEGFEYCTLDPYDRRANFEKAFKTAERLAGCPPLLDVNDLLRMREPDWKCVYTYIQEFYRCLVEKGLVKTKKKMP